MCVGTALNIYVHMHVYMYNVNKIVEYIYSDACENVFRDRGTRVRADVTTPSPKSLKMKLAPLWH